MRSAAPALRRAAQTHLPRWTGRHGVYKTRFLQIYRPKLCELIALRVVDTIEEMVRSGQGPTGWARSHEKTVRVSAWSTTPSASRPVGVAIPNEESARGRAPTLEDRQLSLYLHVDDAVILADGTTAGRADRVMHGIADGLQEAGFGVDDRSEDHQLEKVVGYELQRRPAKIRLPGAKSVLLEDALLYLGRAALADTHALRSVLGVWIWGALFRRDLLCIPHAVFRFLDTYPDRTVRWWESARREAFVMAAVVGLMSADVGAPLATCLFAADAIVASDDAGGYGLVAADVSAAVARDCLLVDLRPGKTVTKLSGEFSGAARPDEAFRRATPFTRLPRTLFREDETEWHYVAAGRWAYVDHITLGEMRVIVLLSHLLCSNWQARRRKYIVLKDNFP